MSSCRGGREARRQRRKAQRELAKRKKANGQEPRRRQSPSNRKSPLSTKEEEQAERQDATIEQLEVMRSQLPGLLKKLSQLKDYRNVKKIKYQLALLMLYGILMFVFQMTSRREANATMTRPQFLENLRLFFPEIDDLPHHDTLFRLLEKIDAHGIEQALIDHIRKLIRKKKLRRYLISKCLPIAIDGSQKFAREDCWTEECLQRLVKKGNQQGDDKKDQDQEPERYQYFVYVLEASLVLRNGMVIPLMSEFLSYQEGDTDANKQDCEQRAFMRLAARLKSEFPRLQIMVLLDGLYANGPIMDKCRSNNWQFMIVFKDGSLPTVWEDAKGIRKLDPDKRQASRIWGDRVQEFWWVNDLEYRFGPSGRNSIKVHLVVCEETWQEIKKQGCDEVTKRSRHAWLSSQPLNRDNLHERCNLGARHRWGIESSFLVEKHHGYSYEHCFAYDWNAMKGYHYLMRIGHMINVLAHYSERLARKVRSYGIQRFIKLVCETIVGPWLNPKEVRQRLKPKPQLRLV